MPFYPTQEEPDFEALSLSGSATPDQDFATAYKTGLSRTPGAAIAATVVGSVSDLVDTASSSVGLTSRQQINNTFLSAIGSPGLTSWWNQNQGAVEVGSGIAGIIVSDAIAKKILEPGSLAMRAIRGVPIAGKIAALDAQYERAVRLAQVTTREAATRGMVGVERFNATNMSLAALGSSPLQVSARQAKRAVFRTQAAKGLARNATTELVMATLLNQNSFLYADELSHNVAWSFAGLGLGAGIDSMVSAYTMRKIANQRQIRRINAAAYDVSGLESQRLHAPNVVDELLKASGADPKDMGFMFSGAGATTDRITSLSIAASELQKPRSLTERGRALFSKRESIANPTLTMAQEELNKVTVRGLSGVSRAGFGTKMEGLGAPLNESLVRDPAFMYGVEEIGTSVDNMTRQQTAALRDANLKKRFDKVQELLANDGYFKRTRKQTKDGEVFVDTHIPLSDEAREALRAEAKELHFKSSQVPMTMLEPGEWAPIEFGAVADEWQPRALREEGGLGVDNIKVWQREKLQKGEETLGLSSDGELYLPAGARLESLKLGDMLTLYQIGNKAVRDFVATGTKFNVPKNPNWFQLDMAEQILKASGDPASVVFPGSMTRQTAMVESFSQKVTALRRREQAIRMANKRGSAESLDAVKAFEQKVFFNLPRLNSYQAGLLGTHETPLDIILAGLRTGKEVKQMSHEELVQLLNDSRKITQFTEETKDTLESLQGNSFNFLMDRDGTPIKPIIAYKRPLAPFEWTRDELFTRQAMHAAHVKDTLVGQTADPITREIVSAIMSNPNSAEARRIMELADDQQRSFIPGFQESAPQTATGSLINAVTSRERRDVDNLIMRAASIVKEDESRITGAVMQELIQKTMGDSITIVNSARNTESKLLLNQFHSFRQGWELAREPIKVPMPNGKTGFQFVLDHESLKNQQRFERLFDKKLEKGQALLNPNGTEIVLDELAMDVMQRMQLIHEAEIQMKNTLLRSQGLPELKAVPWYAPPSNTKGKYIGYTFDAQDSVISDMTVVANSPQQLQELANEMQKSKAWKAGYTFRQRSDVESFMTLWDKAQMDFIAPNTTAIQPNKQNFGRTSGSLLNPNAFDEALVTVRDNMVKHGTDILEVLFAEPLKAARARSKLARVEQGIGEKSTRHSSIYDRYTQNLLGRNALGASDSYLGDIYDAVESRLNGLLSSPQAMNISETYGALKDFIRTAIPGQSPRGKQFDKLSQSLGKYMPYRNAMEMVERETGNKTPLEVAEITSKLSWFEAGSRLRWLESMHAVANVGSLIANTPAIVKALQPLAGESIEQAAQRNSSLVMLMETPRGEKMVLPNVPKLMYNSMQDLWKKTPELLEFDQKATRLGYMDQEVAEFQRQWGAIDSKEGWRGFVFGNKAAEGSGPGARVARSGGLDKWLGLLSDKSEQMSRQWGMYAGRRVAKAMGIENVDAQIAFAHDLTNKMIANYDPRNRPEIFQGALGAPIGLFQSYVFNYYQRMFRYLESGNSRALATQYAMQSAVFGVQSVPGWDALNWAFFDHQQSNNEDPVESMYRRFGTEDADLIMHGVLSNIPKIFGADGISLYTRGDAQFRMPAVNLPVADTMRRLWGGIAEGIGQFKDQGGISLNHAAEIASNMITNRPLAGMLEVGAANGYDTSWDGQVVSQARTGADQLFRILGVRAMRQQKEIEMFYADKNAQTEQNAHKTRLNSATRAAIRDGRYEQVPRLFEQYVNQGGDPRYYSRWVKSSFESALDSRGERLLSKALNKQDGSRDATIGRLLDSQVDINEDDLTDTDYGRQEEIDQVVDQAWESNPETPPYPGTE